MTGTVLIVDDHAGFRAKARAVLELDGWKVVGEAEDAAHALRQVAALRPEVVLLDIGLPDRSGLDVAEDLRGGPAVVLVSTHDAEDYEALALRRGACGFLAKAELSGDALSSVLAASA